MGKSKCKHHSGTTFAVEWGIDEVEANGSGCMLLASELDAAEELLIVHSEGSQIRTQRLSTRKILLGGLLKNDHRRWV